MNHPYELLADLVDGTLAEDDLPGVQAHLDSCSSCREDLVLAREGREAARSLPHASAPPDLPQSVVLAAGGRGHGAPGWYRWAGVAAAAALVLAIAISLPGGQSGRERRTEDAAALASAGQEVAPSAAGGEVSLIVEDRNYDEKSLQRLADASRSGDTLAGAAAQPQKGSGDPKGALRCVTKAVTDNATGRLTRLIHARFQGRDAYFAVYLEASSADKPKLAVVWVASRDDCSLLSLAFSRI